MKILIYNVTIFTPRTKARYDNTRSSKICQQNFIKQVLEQHGHQVDYKQSFEENVDFNYYDKIILSPLSPFSLYACEYNITLMYNLFHNYSDKIYVTKSDSSLKSDLRAGMRSPEALVKTLLNPFNNNRLDGCKFIGGPEKVLEIIKHQRPILISTICPSKLKFGLGSFNTLPNKFYGYNMNAAVKDLSALYLPIKKKIRRWCSADMSQSTTDKLMQKKQKWPQLLFGKKTEIKSQAQVIKEYRKSMGVLSYGAISFCAFQRLRFQTAAYCGSVIACDRGYGKILGQPFKHKIETIQKLSDDQLQDLANAQREIIFSQFQTKDQVYQVLTKYLQIE